MSSITGKEKARNALPRVSQKGTAVSTGKSPIKEGNATNLESKNDSNMKKSVGKTSVTSLKNAEKLPVISNVSKGKVKHGVNPPPNSTAGTGGNILEPTPPKSSIPKSIGGKSPSSVSTSTVSEKGKVKSQVTNVHTKGTDIEESNTVEVNDGSITGVPIRVEDAPEIALSIADQSKDVVTVSTSEADGSVASASAVVEENIETPAASEPVNNNGYVTLIYERYDEKFPIVNGTTAQANIDEEYCLSFVMPDCLIHLSVHEPAVKRTREADGMYDDLFLTENPPGTYHGLVDDHIYYVYVEQQADQLARDQEQMRRIAAGMEGAIQRDTNGDIVKPDDGRAMESCSCIYGNPCVDEYGCKDWGNRYAIAKKNGWKGF